MAFQILNVPYHGGSSVCALKIRENGAPVSGFALRGGSSIELELSVKRPLAVVRACLLYTEDGCESIRTEGVWCGLEKGFDLYRFTLPGKTRAGLYFCSFELHTSAGRLYAAADGSAAENETVFCKLLVCDERYARPSWLDGGIIYHVFVDRFFRGSVNTPLRGDAYLIEDWEHGVPEYPEKPGGFLRNNGFFGGTLWGVAEKLDYLKGLGVRCIYLSPIFEAYSNHKYDVGDYMKVDAMFGGDAALQSLIDRAGSLGIGVILDGVFNHVGDNSLYFDRYGKYGGKGACSGKDSPYRDWFNFTHFPDEYEAWWGISNLPRVRRTSSFRRLICGEGGVIDKYMGMGAAGFRLDVVDELEADFTDELCAAIKQRKSDAYIVGEVWENAAYKAAYGERKRYFQGAQLDAVMNYPLRDAIIEYVMRGDAVAFAAAVSALYDSYPAHKSACLMNILGTHDTVRILTVLGGDEARGCTNAELSVKRMDSERRRNAVERLKKAVLLQMTLPGIPCVYYGDEVGAEGYGDPFNRCPYPWSHGDADILGWYKKLSGIRASEKALSSPVFTVRAASGGLFSFCRGEGGDALLVYVNAGNKDETLRLDSEYVSLLTGKRFSGGAAARSGGLDILKKFKTAEG